MAYGIRLHVWGERACFTRPEMKVERVSYDVMTPSAARGVLEAIHWKPAISWVVDRIHVLKPIRFENVRRNEVKSKVHETVVRKAIRQSDGPLPGIDIAKDRVQRASLILRDVAYLIDAHFVLTKAAKPGDTPAKHISMFNRRAESGQCFHRPYLGTREFAADFALVRGQAPPSELPESDRDRDLGWMLHDLDFRGDDPQPRFFRAKLEGGIVRVPPFESEEARS